MNREHRKKSFEKNYYKTYRQVRVVDIETIVPTVCPAGIWITSRGTGRRTAAV